MLLAWPGQEGCISWHQDPPAQERSFECCKKKCGVSHLVVCLPAAEVMSVLRTVILGKAEVHWLLMGKCALKILRCSLDVFSVWRKCQAVIETTVVPAGPYDSGLTASNVGSSELG